MDLVEEITARFVLLVSHTMRESQSDAAAIRAHELSALRSLALAGLVLLSAFALKATASVTMPLAFAMFVLVLYAPVLTWFRRFVPKWLAALATFIAVLCSLGAFVGALWLCADMLAERAPKYRDALAQLGDDVFRWGQHLGLPEEALRGRTTHLLDALGGAASGAASGIASMLGAFVLVVTFAMLAMSETDAWQRKLKAQWGDHGLETASTISSRCRAYMVTRTFTSAATGILTGLFAWAVGLDLAFVWGVTAFVLNYIPTLGSIIAIIPPTLLAVVQLGGLGAFALFVGLTLIQVSIGSFLDPKLQGRTLQLSPIVLLFSIGLWGYIWGVAGALLAVPLTMGIAVVCSQFPRSRWVATMLAEDAVGAQRPDAASAREHGRGSEHALSSDIRGGAV